MVDTYVRENLEIFNSMTLERRYESAMINLLVNAVNLLTANKRDTANNDFELEINGHLTHETPHSHDIFADKLDVLHKKFKVRHPKPHWWDDEVTEWVKKKRSASEKVLTHPSQENLKTLLETQKETKKKTRKVRIEKFRKFTEKTLTPDSDIKEVWRVVNSFKNINILRKPISHNDLMMADNAREFIMEHCRNTVDPEVASPFDLGNLAGDSGFADDLESPFLLEELDMAINSSTEDSSPELDQVDYKMIRKTPATYRNLLLDIINQFMLENRYHHSWKQFLIILIPKNPDRAN